MKKVSLFFVSFYFNLFWLPSFPGNGAAKTELAAIRLEFDRIDESI
jgi:hypothetical protein